MLFELLKDHETGMSKFQDDYFVTMRAGGTLYGQYKQALRELYKRYRGLRESVFEKQRKDIDIEELRETAKTAESKFDRQRANVDLQEQIIKMEEADRVIKDTKREFINFYAQAIFYKEQLGELTEAKKDLLEREMWAHKCKGMAATDIILQGRFSSGTIDLLRSFPTEMRDSVLAEIKNHDQLLGWFEQDNTEFLPPQLSLDLNVDDIMEAITC